MAGCARAPSKLDSGDDTAIPRWVAVEPLEAVDRRGILLLLKQKNYAELELLFGRYLSDSKLDPTKEHSLIQAYRAFETANKDVYVSIEEWIKTRPTSAVAATAIAYCAAEIGWQLRGLQWARETTPQQFEGMYRTHARVVEDARAAIALAPDNPAPYRILLQIGRTYDTATFYSLVDEAIARFPASFSIWANIFDSRTAVWGGTLAETVKLAKLSQEYVGQNPRLRVLMGKPYYFQGRIVQREERYSDAFDLFTQAIAFGDDSEYLMARAWVARKLGRFDQARADGVRAKTMFPDLDRSSLASYLQMVAREEAQWHSSKQ